MRQTVSRCISPTVTATPCHLPLHFGRLWLCEFPGSFWRAKAPLCKGSCRRSRLRDCSDAVSTSAAGYLGSTRAPTIAAERRFRQSEAGKTKDRYTTREEPRTLRQTATALHQPYRHGYAVPPPLAQGRLRLTGGGAENRTYTVDRYTTRSSLVACGKPQVGASVLPSRLRRATSPYTGEALAVRISGRVLGGEGSRSVRGAVSVAD